MKRSAWTARVGGGPCRTSHAAVAIDEKIYSFGGFCVDEDTKKRPMDVHVLDTDTLRWTQIPLQGDGGSVPSQRYGHSVVAYGQYVYLWGGRNELEACNILYRFDTASLTWHRPGTTGENPRERRDHSACVVGSGMYVFCGYGVHMDTLRRDLHVLDLDTLHWSSLNTTGVLPGLRGLHTAVAIGNRIYVWSGRSSDYELAEVLGADEDYSKRLLYLDTTSNVWVQPAVRGTRPRARCGHAAFVYKGEMYVFGGYNGLLGATFGDMHKYNPETSEWSLVQPLGKGPCPRTGHCCCLVGDRVFIFGGMRPENVTDSVREFNNCGPFRDHSDMHVLDFVSTLKTLCLVAVGDSRQDASLLIEKLRLPSGCTPSKNGASSSLPSA